MIVNYAQCNRLFKVKDGYQAFFATGNHNWRFKINQHFQVEQISFSVNHAAALTVVTSLNSGDIACQRLHFCHDTYFINIEYSDRTVIVADNHKWIRVLRACIIGYRLEKFVTAMQKRLTQGL